MNRRDSDTLAVFSRTEADGLFVATMFPAIDMTARNIAGVLANDDQTSNNIDLIKSEDQLRQQRLVHADNRKDENTLNLKKISMVEIKNRVPRITCQGI